MNNGIGSRIKEIRKQQKMTQAELGSFIGKKEVTIRKYENGSIEVPLNVLHDIAKSLNTSIANLMGIDVDTVVYSPELGAIARKMHTHYDYVAGITTDKIFERYNFKDLLEHLNFDDISTRISYLPEEVQVAIYNALSKYISLPFEDWYFMKANISNYELDKLFILSNIIDSINSFSENISNHLLQIPEDENLENITFREPTIDDFLYFSQQKNQLLNNISSLLDEVMSLNLKEQSESLYLRQILESQKNSIKCNTDCPKSDTTTD